MFDDGTTFFTNDVDDMLDLTRMDSAAVNYEDINAMMKKATDLLNKKSDVQVRKMYTRYQNLWTDFWAKNNMRDKYNMRDENNDVTLVCFLRLSRVDMLQVQSG